MNDNWENCLNLRHTLDRMYLTNTLEVQYLYICLHSGDNKVVLYANKRILCVTREWLLYQHGRTYIHTICKRIAHTKTRQIMSRRFSCSLCYSIVRRTSMKTAMFAHRVYTKDYETGNGISILFVEVQGGDCEVHFWFRGFLLECCREDCSSLQFIYAVEPSYNIFYGDYWVSVKSIGKSCDQDIWLHVIWPLMTHFQQKSMKLHWQY